MEVLNLLISSSRSNAKEAGSEEVSRMTQEAYKMLLVGSEGMKLETDKEDD